MNTFHRTVKPTRDNLLIYMINNWVTHEMGFSYLAKPF